jgi:hypothetical protein
MARERIGRKVFDLIQKENPIFSIITLGSNLIGRCSTAKIINQKSILLLLQTSPTSHSSASKEIMANINLPTEIIRVDIPNIREFIQGSYNLLMSDDIKHTKSPEKYSKHVVRNIAILEKVLASVDEQGNWHHQPFVSDFGRTFYSGFSILNVPSQLRPVVFGKHYQYDLVASNFAIKMLMLNDIGHRENIEQDIWEGTSYTREYIKNRSIIRDRLAKLLVDVYNPEEIIKQVITSLGFGARMDSRGYWDDSIGAFRTNSLAELLGKTNWDRLKQDPWFSAFKQECYDLNRVLVEYYKSRPELIQEIFGKTWQEVEIICISKTGRFSPNKFAAFLYQQMETMIMTSVFGDQERIVRIHDAIITANKISTERLLDYRYHLGQLGISVEQETFDKWSHTHSDQSLDDKSHEQEHREFISRQEHQVRVFGIRNNYKHDELEHHDVW